MKRTRGRIGALVMVMMLLLGGCGEKPITLTDKEEDIIVNYASHIVSKYNKRQTKGVVELLPEVPATEEVTEPEPETEEPLGTEHIGTEEDIPDGQTPGDVDEPSYATLNEAVGLAGVEVTYTGAEVRDSYASGDYYSLDAPDGRQYVVLYFSLRNTGTEAVACDMLSSQPIFKADINGTVKSTALPTILLNDLSTYQGTLEAGGTAEVVLLFEVDADSVQAVDSVVLNVTKNGAKLATKL